jgi:hypothetical protein
MYPLNKQFNKILFTFYIHYIQKMYNIIQMLLYTLFTRNVHLFTQNVHLPKNIKYKF